jgi:hypothetical protein
LDVGLGLVTAYARAAAAGAGGGASGGDDDGGDDVPQCAVCGGRFDPDGTRVMIGCDGVDEGAGADSGSDDGDSDGDGCGRYFHLDCVGLAYCTEHDDCTVHPDGRHDAGRFACAACKAAADGDGDGDDGNDGGVARALRRG